MSPFFLQGKALGPSQACSPYNKENENGGERTLCKSTQWRGGLLNEMVPMCSCQGWSP
jgi:hypothetical protein